MTATVFSTSLGGSIVKKLAAVKVKAGMIVKLIVRTSVTRFLCSKSMSGQLIWIDLQDPQQCHGSSHTRLASLLLFLPLCSSLTCREKHVHQQANLQTMKCEKACIRGCAFKFHITAAEVASALPRKPPPPPEDQNQPVVAPITTIDQQPPISA